jgi:linoleoyl-CoA desaturase
VPVSESSSGVRVSFASGGAFLRDTRREAAAYLADATTRARAGRLLFGKAVLAIALLVASWIVVVAIRPRGAPVAVALVGLGVGALLTALCVQHDANHGAFFGRRRADRLMGWTSDALLGFSSYAWRVRHNVAHHTYTNVDGYDADITQLPVLRLAPRQRARPWHRWQALYIWPLYGLMTLRLQTYGDAAVLIRRRIGRSVMRRPTGWDLVGLVLGKLIYVTWALVVPMLVYPWWLVLTVYTGLSLVLSLVMVVVFQLAHCVEEADWPSADELQGARRQWAEHEVETTVNFCPDNRVLTFLLGGLNYQIEHHLFPRLPHTHYPALAVIVRRNATRHGVRYTTQPSLRAALGSHLRHIRRLARRSVPIEIEMG